MTVPSVLRQAEIGSSGADAGGVRLPAERVSSARERPEWQAVEALLARLAATRATFSTATSTCNRIASYAPGRRLRLENEIQSGWIQIEHVKTCWETFERLGRIRREDVLEPGRRSAFIMGLFQQLAGVEQETEDEAYLVLPPAHGSASAQSGAARGGC